MSAAKQPAGGALGELLNAQLRSIGSDGSRAQGEEDRLAAGACEHRRAGERADLVQHVRSNACDRGPGGQDPAPHAGAKVRTGRVWPAVAFSAVS
jgi:hypothetical protein